jgi:hypothetical protein
MKKRRNPPYSNFRDSVDINFGESSGYAGQIDDKYYLGILMQRRDSALRRKGERRFYFNAGYKYDIKDKKSKFVNTEHNRIKHARQKQELLDIAWKEVTGKSKQHVHTSIVPRGFKKHQVRDSRTGRIVGWI